jgi:hypothetical protein
MREMDVPWPQKGQAINPPTDHWPNRAILSSGYGTRSSSVIAAGYRDTAELIFAAIQHRQGAIDVLTGPLVFTWRHHIEVHIKADLEYMWRADGVRPDYNLGHQLLVLWRAHQETYRRFDVPLSDSDRAATEAAGELVKQLDELDPSSFHFRYATDRKGVQLAVPEAMNVDAFHSAMLGLSNYLGAVVDHLDAALEIQGEYDADMRADLEAEMRQEFGPG